MPCSCLYLKYIVWRWARTFSLRLVSLTDCVQMNLFIEWRHSTNSLQQEEQTTRTLVLPEVQTLKLYGLLCLQSMSREAEVEDFSQETHFISSVLLILRTLSRFRRSNSCGVRRALKVRIVEVKSWFRWAESSPDIDISAFRTFKRTESTFSAFRQLWSMNVFISVNFISSIHTCSLPHRALL